MRFLSEKNDVDVQKALAAMVLYDSLGDAVDYLLQEGITTTVEKLEVWRDHMYAERFQRRREELAPMVEARLASNLLDNAGLAADVTRLAIEKTRDLLKEGRAADPSRVARDLSQVATQAVDKRLALQGRPTQVTEDRSLNELVRGLVALKVLKLPQSAPVDAEATVIEETASAA